MNPRAKAYFSLAALEAWTGCPVFQEAEPVVAAVAETHPITSTDFSSCLLTVSELTRLPPADLLNFIPCV